MALPSPHANSNKELIPLLKGVPAPRTSLPGEFICYRFFYEKRIVYEGPVQPVKGFPETSVFVWAKHRSRLRFYFSYENWRRSTVDSIWHSIALPAFTLGTSGRVKVVIPGVKPGKGGKSVIPAEVQAARRRVSAVRKDRIPRGKPFPKSSTVRPGSESKQTADTSSVEGNNGGYFFIPTPSSYTGYTRSWSGVRTPGFGKLKKSELPVNPHAVTITETVDSTAVLLNFIPSTGIYFNTFRRFTADYAAPPGVSHLADAQFKALRKLIEKANGNIEGNLAQDFAQIGQTTRLITNTATRLTKSIKALKKGNIPGAVDALWRGHMPRYRGKGPSIGKSLASNWLELQYGWKPLIQDVKASMEALKRLNSTSSPLVRRVTSSATSESQVVTNFNHRLIAQRAGFHLVVTKTRAKYVLRYKIDDRLKAFLAQTGFTNPLNLFWEILPFSFVVDWFLPIGPYLETLSSWDGLVFLDGSFTRFTRGMATSSLDFSGTQAGQQYEEHGRFRRSTVLLNREKLSSFPSAKFPTSFKNGLASTTHATNALALLRAAFR